MPYLRVFRVFRGSIAFQPWEGTTEDTEKNGTRKSGAMLWHKGRARTHERASGSLPIFRAFRVFRGTIAFQPWEGTTEYTEKRGTRKSGAMPT
jgi:hypothetical protein